MYTGAKLLLPNQHDLLHPFYGEGDCCLCKAEALLYKAEQRIINLELEMIDLKKQLKALSESFSQN